MTVKQKRLTKRFTYNVASNVNGAASALGGYTVPDSMMLGIKTAIKDYSGLMRAATVLFTDNGRPLPIPYVNDTGNTGVLVAEEESATKTATVTFSNGAPNLLVTWTSHGLTANDVISFSGGTMPTGITEGTSYFVKTVVSVNTFHVSATVGGAAIAWTNNGSGTISIHTYPPIKFGQIVLQGWKFSSKIVRVSREFLQDTSMNVPEFIGRTLGERIMRKASEYFISGTGTNEPKGLENIVDIEQTVTTAGSALFDDFNQFIDFRHTLDPSHRAASGCAYLCNTTALTNLIGLQDLIGRSLLQPNLDGPRFDGRPKADWMIYGQPVYIDPWSHSGEDNAKPFMYYGDLSKFIIRISIDVQPLQLNELYAASGQVGFVAFARIDSNQPLLIPAPIVSARYQFGVP